VKDTISEAVILILVCISTDCLIRNKKMLGALTSIIATDITIKKGLSTYSSIAISTVGIFEVALGNKKIGYRLGELSLKIVSEIPAPDIAAAVIGQSSLHLLFLKRRLRNLISLFPIELEKAFAIGDSCTAMTCLFAYVNARLWTGENLQSLEKYLRDVHRRLFDFGQKELMMYFNPTLQLVLNLQNSEEDWKDLIVLTGEVMDENDFMKQSNELSEWLLQFYKMFLRYMFGFYKEAESIGKNLFRHFLAENSFLCLPFNLYYGLISYEQYRSTGRRRHLRVARKCRKFLEHQHDFGNPNATPYLRIIEVEELSLRSNNVLQISQACNRAIEFQIVEGLTHLEALSNEQANRILRSKMLISTGDNLAGYYFDQTIRVYREKWGVAAKYEWLLHEYSSFD